MSVLRSSTPVGILGSGLTQAAHALRTQRRARRLAGCACVTFRLPTLHLQAFLVLALVLHILAALRRDRLSIPRHY